MNIENLNVLELEAQEIENINGGSELSDALLYGLGVIVHGFVVFGTEGGRNAGICVR